MNGKSIFDSQLFSDLDISITSNEEGSSLFILTIKARVEYNGTTLQCLIDGGLSGQSEIASLMIQGRS